MAETTLPFSVTSMVEDVIQQNGKRLCDIDLAARKAEEASFRRYEAARWLRKTVGVVGGKDLPAEPSEEEFRLGLRSGIILCNVLNKVQSGAVQKVVEAPIIVPDGAALSAYQYFENVRNFLVAVEEMGLPTFEASDLEQGGKSSRVVNCVLALKSYSDWKQGGGCGSWKFGGNLKPSPTGKQFVRKNSEPFMNSFARASSLSALDDLSSEQFSDLGHDPNEMGNSTYLQTIVRDLLLDKKQEEIPIIVENIINKVTEEFERRLASRSEQMRTTSKDNISGCNKSPIKPPSLELKMEDKVNSDMEKEGCCCKEDTQSIEEDIQSSEEDTRSRKEDTHSSKDNTHSSKEDTHSSKDNTHSSKEGTHSSKDDTHNSKDDTLDKEIKEQVLKQQMLVEQQHRDLQELKHSLSSTRADIQFLQMNYQEEVTNLGKHLQGLAQAAAGYQKVLEENRKLYNQVQDLRGNIRVYCRVRPFLPGQPNRSSTVDYIDDGTISILTPSKYGKEGRKSFTFNKFFGPSATQEEVFADTQPLIRSVLDGYNVCIFAYGQTGSGKTYTMNGPHDLTEETMGVNYRALSDLFLISEQRKNIVSYNVSCQMMEIYNEQVRDLLTTDGLNKRLEIRNSSQKGLNVPDANTVPVASTSDVINLMNLGHKNRAVSATSMNDRSSRSHSCLTVHVQGKDLTSGATLRGCMHLVDLAGSERVDKSEVVGDRLKEAQHINKSLSALGDVIASLAQKNSHVPYRNSKLTQLLQDALGGQAKTLMFVHISPELDAIGETLSTLKFAERVSSVELGAARTNKDSSDVKELKEQIASLKAALARKEGESAHYQHSKSSSSEIPGLMSAESSPSHHSWQSLGSMMEEVGNIEVGNNTSTKQKRKSLDLQDLLTNSPPWPPTGSPGLKAEGKEAGIGDWVDKVMVNKQDWAEDNKKSPEMFYQRHNLDPSKVYPEQPVSRFLDNDASRNRYESATTDESDDRDTATSDCSEPDFLWQLSVPKATNIPNGGSKLKKPSPRLAKSPEVRSLIPAPPTRRLSNGGASPLHKTGKQPGSADGRRKLGSGR